MVRCSRCGGLVSEFDARCPDCGEPVAIAPPVESPESERPAQWTNPEDDPYLQGADFPAPPPSDEEGSGYDAQTPAHPPPGKRHSVRPRAALLATAVVLSAGVAAGVLAGEPSSGPSSRLTRPQGLKALYGRVVADNAGGGAVTYTPASRRTAAFSPRGTTRAFTPVSLSPDGTAWLDSTGTVWTATGGRLRAARDPAATSVSHRVAPAMPDPFAEGGRAVVTLDPPRGRGGTEASIVTVADGRQEPLGVVDKAAGDPQNLGAFASVPVATGPPGADQAVELLSPGRPPQVLATAGHLDEAVGWLGTTPVRLSVYPNPTGDALAVVLTPLARHSGDDPMVVLDRTGGLLAALGDWSGPVPGGLPVWSPGGHQLAYPTYTSSGPALAIGSETGAIGTVPAPPGTVFGDCLWSLSSTDVVCQARIGHLEQWLYALPTSNRFLSTASAGTPVAWIAGPLP